MKLLNGGFEDEKVGESLYWNSSSGTCYNSENSSTTQCDFTNIGLKNDTTRNLISTENYYFYCPSSGELYADQLYNQERGNDGGRLYDSSDSSDTLIRNGVWQGKVALLYPSDHAYGATPGSCMLSVYNWSSSCLNSDGFAYSEEERFLTTSYVSHKAWYARKISTLQGHVTTDDAAEAKKIRPVLHLYATQEFKAGNGSISNPFQLTVN